MCHKKTNEYTLCINNNRIYLSDLKRKKKAQRESKSFVMKKQARQCEKKRKKTLNTLCFLTRIDSQLCRVPSESMAKQLPTSPAERLCTARGVPSVFLRDWWTFSAWLQQFFQHAGINPWHP